MSISIIKSTDKMGVVTLTKRIGNSKNEVKITDPKEFAHYIAELAKIDSGDSKAGRLA